jgi:hypothetical protein
VRRTFAFEIIEEDELYSEAVDTLANLLADTWPGGTRSRRTFLVDNERKAISIDELKETLLTTQRTIP